MYNLKIQKVAVHIDIKVDENSMELERKCNPKKPKVEVAKQNREVAKKKVYDNIDKENAMIKVRSFVDVHNRCKMTTIEPKSYEKVAKPTDWKVTM